MTTNGTDAGTVWTSRSTLRSRAGIRAHIRQVACALCPQLRDQPCIAAVVECRARPCAPAGPGRSALRWRDENRPSGRARQYPARSAVTSCSATVDLPAPGAPVRPDAAFAGHDECFVLDQLVQGDILRIPVLDDHRSRFRVHAGSCWARPAARQGTVVLPTRAERSMRSAIPPGWVVKYAYAP